MKAVTPVLIVIALLFAACTAAMAFGLGKEGARGGFGSLGSGGKSSPPVPQPTGKILLVDAASFILKTDATSKVCRAGGC